MDFAQPLITESFRERRREPHSSKKNHNEINEVTVSRNRVMTRRSSVAQPNVEETRNAENDLKSPQKTPGKRKQNRTDNDHSSPPKQSCTPSTLLKDLCLNSPEGKQTVERHSRKELFPANKSEESSAAPRDEFSKARVALHTHNTNRLPGREEELSKLNDFIKGHLNNRTSGSLYVSGPPGTGKTACLSYVMEQPDVKGQYRVIYVNCTSVKTPATIFMRIASELKLKVPGKTLKANLSAIEKHLSKSRSMILMVLDEIDQLDSRGQSVLYTVFEWPATHPDGVVLVGIANALDLTDRTLPRLKAKVALAPQLLHFKPYTKQQLVNIITDRLKESGASSLFPPAALQLLAAKVATMSGDARRALDMGRRLVEKAGQERREAEEQAAALQQSAKSIGLTSPRKSPRKPMAILSPIRGGSSLNSLLNSPNLKSPKSLLRSPETRSPRKENASPIRASPRKRIDFSDNAIKSAPAPPKLAIDTKSVMAMVSEVYGASQSLGRSADGSGEELPLQQKLAVCSLLLILRKGKNKDVTVGKLHEVYRRVSLKRHMDPLDQGAFLGMLSLVEARGLLNIRGKPTRLSKVCLQWVEDEIVAALRDKELLASIMNDVACLS